MTLLKAVLIVLGTLSLGVGLVGIFIPGLPTTPFLLLTAGLYMRSSGKLYQAIVTSPRFGPYIQDFQRRKGLTRSGKVYAISMMWIMILVSGLFFMGTLGGLLTLFAAGAVGTLIMGIIVPTRD
jgi:hypothetical protein